MINVELPPLRERISDIPLLAKHFLEEVCEEAGKTMRGFPTRPLAALQRYHWPGNVRELQNVVERAVLLGKSDMIELDDLPRAVAAAGPTEHRAGCRSHAQGSAWPAPSGRSSSKCSRATIGTALPRPRCWASTAPRSTRR